MRLSDISGSSILTAMTGISSEWDSKTDDEDRSAKQEHQEQEPNSSEPHQRRSGEDGKTGGSKDEIIDNIYRVDEEEEEDDDDDENPGFETTSVSLMSDPYDIEDDDEDEDDEDESAEADPLLGDDIDTSGPDNGTTTPGGVPPLPSDGTNTTNNNSKNDHKTKKKTEKSSKYEKDISNIPDSFDSYIVVSVLTATASFAALLDDNPDHMNSLAKSNPLAHNTAVLLGAVCTLAGMYATVVFSFSSIYGRTAIGNGRIRAYDGFLKATAGLREKAFRAYLLSLMLFIALLIIAATDKINASVRVPFLGFLLLVSVLIYRDWTSIIVAAGPIFGPPEPEASGSSSDDNSSRSAATTTRRHRSDRRRRRGRTAGFPPAATGSCPQPSVYDDEDEGVRAAGGDCGTAGCWALRPTRWMSPPSRNAMTTTTTAGPALSHR